MEDMEERLVETEARSKSNTKRLDKVEERLDKQDELIRGLGAVSVKIGVVERDVTEIKGDVKSLAGKPGTRWEKLTETVIGIVVGALRALKEPCAVELWSDCPSQSLCDSSPRRGEPRKRKKIFRLAALAQDDMSRGEPRVGVIRKEN